MDLHCQYLCLYIDISGNFRFSYGKRQKWIFKKRRLVDGFGYDNCNFIRFYKLKLSEYFH